MVMVTHYVEENSLRFYHILVVLKSVVGFRVR